MAASAGQAARAMNSWHPERKMMITSIDGGRLLGFFCLKKTTMRKRFIQHTIVGAASVAALVGTLAYAPTAHAAPGSGDVAPSTTRSTWMQPGNLRATAAQTAVEVAPQVTPVQLEYYAFGVINNWRRKGGLSPYKWNGALQNVARPHSQRLLATDPKRGCPNAHQCPGEPDPWTRMRNGGIKYTWASENVGLWWSSGGVNGIILRQFIDKIHDQFMAEGPGGGHHDAIMSKRLQEVGVGVAFDAHHLWLTEDFIAK